MLIHVILNSAVSSPSIRTLTIHTSSVIVVFSRKLMAHLSSCLAALIKLTSVEIIEKIFERI